MIRTTLSIFVLLGSLLVLSLLLAESKADLVSTATRGDTGETIARSALRSRLRLARQTSNVPQSTPATARGPQPLQDPVSMPDWSEIVPPASKLSATEFETGEQPAAPIVTARNLSEQQRVDSLRVIREALRGIDAMRKSIPSDANGKTPNESDDKATREPADNASMPAFVEIKEESPAQATVTLSDAGTLDIPETASGTDVVAVEPDEPPQIVDESPTRVLESVEPAAETAVAEPQQGEVITKLPVAVRFSPEMIELRERIRDSLAIQFARPESTSDRSPWGIMHALIAYGVDSEILADGRRVNAASWLCWNGSCRGMRLMYARGGQLEVRQGPGYQGHQGQLLAILAQCRVPRDYPLQVDGQKFTIDDLIEYEKLNCKPNTELTFSLIGLSHFLDSDEVWRSRQGQTWNIERLIREELAQPIVGAACGGTHRMMGFSYSLRKRTEQKKPITGQWQRAQEFVDAYHEYTFSLQNPDGSFSTEWFERRAAEPSIERRLQTTGHILEWMVYSLPKEQLQSPRVVRTVDYLTTLMLENRHQKWEVGPRGHAIRALTLYDERVFGGEYGKREKQLAERAESRSLR